MAKVLFVILNLKSFSIFKKIYTKINVWKNMVSHYNKIISIIDSQIRSKCSSVVGSWKEGKALSFCENVHCEAMLLFWPTPRGLLARGEVAVIPRNAVNKIAVPSLVQQSPSIYIKRYVCPFVRPSHFCLSPGDKQFVCPPGDKHF